MSASVRSILEAFQRLTPEEQQEAAREILRGVMPMDSPPLDDEDLARIADESFQDYDRREATWIENEAGRDLAG